MAKDKLTPQQDLFVTNLMSGMSYIAAYEKAGYKPDYSAAHRLARNVKICQEIEHRQTELRKAAEDEIKRNVFNAAQKLGSLMDFSKPDTMLKAALAILSMCGISPTDKQQVDVNANVGITLGDVISRAREKKDGSSGT